MSKDRLHLWQANGKKTMAKPIRLAPKKDGKSWRLSVPPKLSATGKRQNLFYRTQALALAAATDLKAKREEFGNQARAISATIADQAVAADKLLKPWGITILQAAERIAAMEQATASSVPVETALTAYRAAKEEHPVSNPSTSTGSSARNAAGSASISNLQSFCPLKSGFPMLLTAWNWRPHGEPIL